MRDFSGFPILFNAIYNFTGVGSFQSPFSRPNTALSSGASPETAAVIAATSVSLPETPYTPLGDISSVQWASLSASVGGRLHADGAPYARACFDQYEEDEEVSRRNQEECNALQSGYLSEKYRLPHFGSAMTVRPHGHCPMPLRLIEKISCYYRPSGRPVKLPRKDAS
jgi:hypothetical protein